MKQKFFAFLAAALCVGLVFTACKKDNSSPAADNATGDEQVAGQTDDQTLASTASDGIISDANVSMETYDVFSGDYATADRLLCDATIQINENSDPMTMTITYDGANCDTAYTRTGVVVVSMAKGSAWKTAGTTATVSFQSVKVVRNSDKRSVTLSGTQTYTNVSGGLLYQLESSGPITHTVVSDNMSVSFDSSAAKTWSIAKKRVYSFDGGVVITETGTHSDGVLSGIAAWGTNRFGNAFSTAISAPLVFKQSCDSRLTSGAVVQSTSVFSATVTFGLNASGVATDCPGSGHYYYHLDWLRTNGHHLSVVLPY